MSKASVYFTVSNVSDRHDIKEIKRELDTLHGVISASVSDEKDQIAVDFDTTGVRKEQLQKKIQKLGYDITDTKFENHIM